MLRGPYRGNLSDEESSACRVLVPTMNYDATQMVKSCKVCQRHDNFSNQPASLFKPVSASCPFDQWDLDIVGPFSIARAQKKFLLVAVDYFSKWVEAEPLARITEEDVLKFIWKNIVRRLASQGNLYLTMVGSSRGTKLLLGARS